MKRQKTKFALLSISASLGLGICSPAGAAIIMGTDNNDGTWSVGGATFALTNYFSGWSGLIRSDGQPWRWASSEGWYVRESSSAASQGSIRSGTTAISSSVAYSNGVALTNGSTLGTDNWIVLSLESGETDWDTIVQLSIGTNHGSRADDAIIAVYHDDSPTNENILQLPNGSGNVASFSDISADPIPEPSAAILFGLGSLAYLSRRRRR